MAEALRGRGVLVTRPHAQAGALCAALQARGARPLSLPLIEIVPVDAALQAQALAARLDGFRMVFFVSANAVAQGLPWFRRHRAWPPGPPVATLGPGSARALRDAGFQAVVAPPTRFDSEGLLALPECSADALAGGTVLIVRGAGGRDLIDRELIARGVRVESLVCYRRAHPPLDLDALEAKRSEGVLHAITLSSSEAATYFGARIGAVGRQTLLALPVFAPHPRVAEAARAAGFACVIETPAADAGLLAGLEHWFATLR